jgi:hypothetical protein
VNKLNVSSPSGDYNNSMLCMSQMPEGDVFSYTGIFANEIDTLIKRNLI